ncbi:MAG: GUN4 domain-containing protein [Trichodesmium sp. MAG_R02]|jgi:hypothetical protein|nr:GUN4 domain-containing protein [Trichodesmium sp. MAG_R02]
METKSEKIEQLTDKYPEAHLYLAYHAAFFPRITPDLLYYLRVRFKQDTKGKTWDVPWIAVADLLLSNFCQLEDKKIELYKIDRDVRKLLLSCLQNYENLGTTRIKELASFSLDYVKSQYYQGISKKHNFAESLLWLALAYTPRSQEVNQKIERAIFEAYNISNLEELKRIENILQDLAENLELFKPLLAYAHRLNSLASSDLDEQEFLLSEKKIDYTQLRNLLLARKWKEADLETKVVLLKAVSREKEGWLNRRDIEEFPNQDITMIDKLWLKYSDKHFGFSVQKKLWQEINGQENNVDYVTWCCFCDVVKWHIDGKNWLLWEDLTFNLNAPKGHLPALGWWLIVWRDSWRIWRDRWAEFEAFLSIIN